MVTKSIAVKILNSFDFYLTLKRFTNVENIEPLAFMLCITQTSAFSNDSVY